MVFEKVVIVRIIAIWLDVRDDITGAEWWLCVGPAACAERSGQPPFLGATFCIRAKGGKDKPT
jgi:hypothetical protein